MINQKYYNDIKTFPSQIPEGFKLAEKIKLDGEFDKIVVCGMGGSSLYVDLLNDFFEAEKEGLTPIFVQRDYNVPFFADDKTLFLVASYSGNTEESLECFDKCIENNYRMIAISSGGKLKERAENRNIPCYVVPSGLQPRLSTGYFISGILQILMNCGYVKNFALKQKMIDAAASISVDEDKAKTLAKNLAGLVPIIYSVSENSSLARIVKIKFNENSKVQAFWNYFPELNHNEMVGFTNLLMKPLFIVFQSKFTNERNLLRIKVFKKLMQEKSLPVEIVELQGKDVLTEILNGYAFADYVSYYLAENCGIDPEPVKMVEDFKMMLK